MKKFLLSLLIALPFCAFAQVKDSKTFNFSKPLTLTPAVTPSSISGGSVNVVDSQFVNGPITISFGLGSQLNGVFIYNNVFTQGQTPKHTLGINRMAEMIISCAEGASIESVTFDIESTIGGLRTEPKDFGEWDYRQTWSKGNETTPITSVKFINSADRSEHPTITVTYTMPSEILEPVSSTISQDATLEKFTNAQFTFDENITLASTTGITLTAGTKTYPVTASVEGKVVTIASENPIEEDGDYTLNIPAKSFKTAKGYENKAISLGFKIVVPKNTFEYTEVNPAPGRVEKVPAKITLAYPSAIADFEKITLPLKKDGVNNRTVSLSKFGANNDSILIEFESLTTELTENGIYTIDVPEKTIYNAMKGIAADERYNPAFTLTYEISSAPMPDTPTMEKAKQLLTIESIGAPTKESSAYVALKNLTEATLVPSDETLQNAINKYYAETVVNMPNKGKWYIISNVNVNNDSVYLAYADGKVSLTKNKAEAAAFLVNDSLANVLSFKTATGKYLHVLTNNSNYGSTSEKNVTDAYDAKVNDLTVEKLVVATAELEKQFGLFSIRGFLGQNVQGVDQYANAMIKFGATPSIVTDPTSTGYSFNETLSNGFAFEETVEPIVEPDPVEVAAVLASSVITQDNEDLVVEFTTASVISLVDDVQAYVTDEQGVKKADVQVSAISGEDKKFSVNVSSLANGKYKLVLPEGKFTTEVDSKTAKVKENKLSFELSRVEEKFNTTFFTSLVPYVDNIYPVVETYFNELTFASDDSMYVKPDAKVYLKEYWSGITVAEATLVPVKVEGFNYGLRLNFSPAIKIGDLVTDREYSVVLEEATFGDKEYSKYLQGESVRKSQCKVNPFMVFNWRVNNGEATSINSVTNGGSKKMGIYTISGRKVKEAKAPGLYIINGKKVVVK